MRSKLLLFAATCVAALALSAPAGAATVLQFSQQSSTDFVMATVAGSTTTLNTNGGVGTSLSIPITITQLGVLPNQNIPGTETFTPALVSNVGASGNQQFGFNGTIVIATATDANVLTAVVTNGVLNANGASGGFNAASLTTNGGVPTTVILSTDNAAVLAAFGGPSPMLGAVALTLVGITPTQSGSGFVTFKGQNTGNFSTVQAVPEPASLVSMGTAVLAGLGCFGWARRKSVQV